MRRSASNGPKSNKFKRAIEPPVNWLDVPSDMMANILRRIGLVEIIENARKVCSTWCGICKNICKDPDMWRVIYVDAPLYPGARQTREETCKYVLDKSQGRLVDLTVEDSHDNHLLSYVAQRSSKLKRLVLKGCTEAISENWTCQVFKKFTVLEELILFDTLIAIRGIEKAGKYCTSLTTLKLNDDPEPYWGWNEDYVEDDIAEAIGDSLPGLRHLELIGNNMSDYGLKTILDGCPHLETLDLRGCFYVRLKGGLRKRLLQNIKNVKRPRDSLDDCPFI